MEYYLIIKNVHITTAILSLLGFCIRGYWMFTNNNLLQHKTVKIFPHINDTVLLSAAIYCSIMSGMYPFVMGWLGAKVVLLIGYILAGAIALKRGKTKAIKTKFFVLALCFISAIFIIALFKPSI